jgi:hypothetical protein
MSRLTKGLAVGTVATALLTGSAVFAQSDSDYVAALDTMVTDMDLDGLAGQTFEAQTVAAPQLSMLGKSGEIANCGSVRKQAEARGVRVEIFGLDTTTAVGMPNAALAKCKMPETRAIMGFTLAQN